MSDSIIFDGVTKSFRGSRHYRSLRDDVAKLCHPRRRADARSTQPFHALRDVSFSIREGTSTGILGLNGAGKSTALKLMCRIMYPTQGTVRIRGRVGALIEVGSGMHPELSGRENVSLYGRIMGLSSRDIARRFSEIVEFAGIEHAIDQAVKHYSSGMQLRLGFSIVAHLEPDLMLVDEAISVGDAGFQHRCVERMSALVREGRTLVLVSHDLSSVETLCSRALLLSHGQVAQDGPAPDVVNGYLRLARASHTNAGATSIHGEDLSIEEVQVLDAAGDPTSAIAGGGPLTVRLHLRSHRKLTRPLITVALGDGSGRAFSAASMLEDDTAARDLEGSHVVDCRFDQVPLNPRLYDIWGSVRGGDGFGDLIDWQRIARFEVIDTENRPLGPGGVTVRETMPVRLAHAWEWRET